MNAPFKLTKELLQLLKKNPILLKNKDDKIEIEAKGKKYIIKRLFK